MTTDRDFKRLVRKRMAETGESYTVARSHFERDGNPPSQEQETPLPTTVEGFKKKVYGRPRVADVVRHLEQTHGISVSGMTELDLGVFRVDRQGSASWVARVFPPVRTASAARGDAEILSFLEEHGLPAERLARPEAVSLMGRRPVLVTQYVPGSNRRDDATDDTMYELGEMVGRLHAISGSGVGSFRQGGSWHHLSVNGGPRRADIDTLSALFDEGGKEWSPKDQSLLGQVLDDLRALEDFDDLPQALAHPDPCGANLLTVEGEGSVLVDWTGAGRAPRIISFANMISSSTDLTHVEAAASGYSVHVSLDASELGRLERALIAFPFILDCWTVLFQGAPLPMLVSRLSVHRERAKAIAERVRSVSSSGTLGVGAFREAEFAGQDRLF